MDTDAERRGLEWQVGVWDRIAQLYLREVDPRFASVVENAVRRGDLKPGHRVLDLGTGTGSVAVAAAALVGPGGKVTGIDISRDMLALTRRRLAVSPGPRGSVAVHERRAEHRGLAGVPDTFLPSLLLEPLARARRPPLHRRALGRPPRSHVVWSWRATRSALSAPAALPSASRARPLADS